MGKSLRDSKLGASIASIHRRGRLRFTQIDQECRPMRSEKLPRSRHHLRKAPQMWAIWSGSFLISTQRGLKLSNLLEALIDPLACIKLWCNPSQEPQQTVTKCHNLSNKMTKSQMSQNWSPLQQLMHLKALQGKLQESRSKTLLPNRKRRLLSIIISTCTLTRWPSRQCKTVRRAIGLVARTTHLL